MNGNNQSYMSSLAERLNDASIDRVLAVDRAWNIIAWNKTSEKITGICKQAALGKNLVELFPQLEADEEMMSAIRLAFTGKISFLPSRAERFNRSYYENHFIPLEAADGSIYGVMNIMHDVAHRIKAEKHLKRLNMALQQKNKQLERLNTELSTFTSVTGNDLKEPIRRVYTSLEMLIKNDGPRLSDSSKAGLRRMQASINRISLLLEDILALATASRNTSDFSTVLLDDVLRDVLTALQGKITESGAVIEAAQLPPVTGSREMLYHLLYNLLDNAIKFHEEGNQPKIKITAAVKPGLDETGYYCISVEDNGIGFAQEDAKRIFDMFEQLHPKKRFHGSGIGLTVCRKIVEAHGGYMEAESELGKGSTFRCYLSLTPELKDFNVSQDSIFVKDPKD